MSVFAGRLGIVSVSEDSVAVASATALRFSLLAGCVATVCAAAWLGNPLPLLEADPELARLLRGMALIKAAICGLAICALLWRFGQSTSRRLAAAYLAGAWLVAGASMLIWQLMLIPTAAIAFHAGEFTLLVAAWRDVRSGRLKRRPAGTT